MRWMWCEWVRKGKKTKERVDRDTERNKEWKKLINQELFMVFTRLISVPL